MCPVCRGCCLENSLDVKVSGVQIPNTAVARNVALMCGEMGKR
uniref:Interferon regulatory factor 2-binding protein n=1 Tax=virus sp. ctCsQ3 TaxID=2826794 RepID=A0A8S5R723_9VIRU|nr:MAG TPA: interferon regulatory factor 2-binding protein [virus sp. ctCsQ3]